MNSPSLKTMDLEDNEMSLKTEIRSLRFNRCGLDWVKVLVALLVCEGGTAFTCPKKNYACEIIIYINNNFKLICFVTTLT